MDSWHDRVKAVGLDHTAPLPLPGGGATPARHRALSECGRTDLSLARIVEAHADALAIMAEAGRTPRADTLYGVWASEGPHSTVIAHPESRGTWRLEGVKQYCTGASFVRSALVTARCSEDVFLFEVEIVAPEVRAEPATWKTPAMADTATGPVSFRDVIVSGTCVLGGPNWYLTRPGFWHGAIGPAACWAGGAMSLVDAATNLNRSDAHSRAHLGALQASAWLLTAILDESGREIDADPNDSRGGARIRALKVRHLIERQCAEVLDRFGRATGPQLLAYDAQIARQHMALGLYIRQCHAERDLETIPV